jgi:hypothetical protein
MRLSLGLAPQHYPRMRFSLSSAVVITSAVLAGPLWAVPVAQAYKIENVIFPPDVPAEVGGIAFDSKGQLYVGLRRGDILTATDTKDVAHFNWKLFATGFDNTLGIVAPEPGRLVVSHMPELTEATDTDGDGVADRYRNLADGWGLSGNYHETTSLAADGKGGYYIGLGTASHRSPTFVHTRGEYSALGRRGRNYSAVKYRGWTMHLRPDGVLEPYTSGFRVINGILVDDEGHVWSSDNQGDWKAVTPFYHHQKGNFYGHVSSLVWDPKWPAGKDPLATFRADLDAYNALRTYASIEIPHEIVHSGSEPIQIPRSGAFGGFGGQFLLPDASGNVIARLMLENVEGQYQGAATLFIEGMGLHVSNNRLCFSPDGKMLYVGQTARGWGMSKGSDTEGMQRITWLGGTPFTIEKMSITPEGFRLQFTEPLAPTALQPANYAIHSMTYQSRWTYGSEPENERDNAVTAVTAVDAKTVLISIDAFTAGRIYKLHLGDPVASTAQETPGQRDFYYTANRIPKKS